MFIIKRQRLFSHSTVWQDRRAPLINLLTLYVSLTGQLINPLIYGSVCTGVFLPFDPHR